MRLAFSLFMLILTIYFISDPRQAKQDISILINHALQLVKQAFHSTLNFLQNLRGKA